MMGLCMLMGTLGACSGGNGDGDHGGNGCVLFAEVEPNDTEVNAQDLDTVFFGDCVVVDGSIFTAVDEDSYRIFIQEDLTLVVTLDHSSLVDFDVLIFDADTGQLIRDCGTGVVPELCVVAFDVIAADIAIVLSWSPQAERARTPWSSAPNNDAVAPWSFGPTFKG